MNNNINTLPEFSKFLIEEINGYQKLREGWKDGSPSFEAYDLTVRELRKVADKYIQNYCSQPTEEQLYKIVSASECTKNGEYYIAGNKATITDEKAKLELIPAVHFAKV